MNRTDQYTHIFDSVTEDHTIEVRFEEVTPVVTEYTVTIVGDSTKGTIGTGSLTVPANTTYSFKYNDPSGIAYGVISFSDGSTCTVQGYSGAKRYGIESVSTNGPQEGVITQDTTLTVNFVEVVGITINGGEDDNGESIVSSQASIRPFNGKLVKLYQTYNPVTGKENPIKVYMPLNAQITLKPIIRNGDYKFICWRGTSTTDGSSSEEVYGDANGTLTLTLDATTKLVWTPVFRKKKHTIMASVLSDSDSGTIAPVGNVEVNDGDRQDFVITPAEGFQIASITIDDVPLNLDDL